MRDLSPIDPAGHLIHIGPQKTGSTAIQVALSNVRDQLPGHGAYYPRGNYRRRRAGWALGLPGAPSGTTYGISYWNQLVREVRRAGDLRVCISDENYGKASNQIVERIVRDLAGPTTHVVAVAKRFDRLLPSQWQERIKSGQVLDFDAWLRVVLGDEPDSYEYRNFWQGHDFGQLVARWTQFVPPENFTLIIAEEGNRTQLYRVFETLLGLPEGILKSDPTQSNESLWWSDLELLRLIRAMYGEHGGAHGGLAPLRKSVVESWRACDTPALGPKTPPFPNWALERIRELGAERAEQARQLPVRVVGDPGWLAEVDPAPDSGVGADELVVPLDRAVSMVHGILRAQGVFDSPGPGDEEPATDEPGPHSPLDEIGTRELAGTLLRRLTGRR
ncbi:MAG: hypothetical protein V9F00_16555 [Nocardioides sp.]